jgi:hypothetical protein
MSPALINKSLLNATNLKQPNFSQNVYELPTKKLTGSNQFGTYQTPVDRLAKIKQHQNLSPNLLINSINTLQQNSYTAINCNNVSP